MSGSYEAIIIYYQAGGQEKDRLLSGGSSSKRARSTQSEQFISVIVSPLPKVSDESVRPREDLPVPVGRVELTKIAIEAFAEVRA